MVKSANRKKQEKWISSFAEFDFEPVDMTSLVTVGNQSTYVQDGLMITPRGYAVPNGDDASRPVEARSNTVAAIHLFAVAI